MKTSLFLSVLCAAIAVSASLTCGTETCADDEVCNSGGTACQCNTTLYTNSGNPPAPNLTCDGGQFNVQVSKCWLERNGYNTSSIRMDSTDALCMATRDPASGRAQMTLHRPLTTADCNTQADANATHITYRNKLHIYGNTFPVQTRNDVVMNLSCSYPLNMNVSLNVTLHPILGTTVITVPGSNANLTANMIAYTDDTFTTVLTDSNPLYVEDFIYISVIIPDMDVTSLKLKVSQIFAFPDNSSSIQYGVLVNGCPSPDLPADQITVIQNGGNNEARFRLKVFQISGSNTVRLSADLVLCTSTCTPVCTQGRALKSEDTAGSVSILLAATDRYYDVSSASGFSMSWTLSAFIFSWILVKLM